MLASIPHRFVFVCNPKSASTAFETAYRKYANFDIGRGSQWKHLSWREYRRIFGDYFDDHGCETFAIVRHPVDLLESWWRFRQRPKIQNPAHPHHGNSTVGVGFHQWVDEWASEAPPPRAVIIEQRDVLMDSDGRPAPITYVRYERVGELVRELNERIGVDVELPVANASPDLAAGDDRTSIPSSARLDQQIEFYEATLRTN